MSDRLLLALDEHWPARPACPWVVLGADDQPLAEGCSEPSHWPPADSCEVLLCGAQVLWLEVPLPAQNRRSELPRLLAYALEDRLLADPDTQHLTFVQLRREGERALASVLVVDKERLRTLLTRLAALGRAPRRVFAELETAPAGSDEWHLSLAAHGATLRSGPRGGVAIDREFAAPLLSRHLASALAAGKAPPRVCVHVEAGQPQADLAGLAERLGVAVAAGESYRWWDFPTRAATDLLHDEFATRETRGGTLAGLRLPLSVGAALLGVWLIVAVGEVFWLRHQHDELAARMARIYQATVPNSPLVAPAAQMRQQLAQERMRHGLLRHDDALALLAQAAEALGSEANESVLALRFEDGVLDLALAGPALARADALPALLGARGLLASVRRDGEGVHLLLRAELLQ